MKKIRNHRWREGAVGWTAALAAAAMLWAAQPAGAADTAPAPTVTSSPTPSAEVTPAASPSTPTPEITPAEADVPAEPVPAESTPAESGAPSESGAPTEGADADATPTPESDPTTPVDPPTPVPAVEATPTAAPPTPEAITPLPEGVDLAVSVVPSAPSVLPDAWVDWTVTVTNKGNTAATDADLEILAPGFGFTLLKEPVVDFCPPGSSEGSGFGYANPIPCELPSIPAGGSVTVMLTSTELRSGDDSGKITAAVTAGSQTDIDPDNNSASAKVLEYVIDPTQSADLAVSVNPAANGAYDGTDVTWTTTVTNKGPIDADGVTIDFSVGLSAEFVNVAATPECAVVSEGLSCSYDTLAAGTSITLTLTTRTDSVDVGQPYVDVAVASKTDDNDRSNNKDYAEADSPTFTSDLSVTISPLVPLLPTVDVADQQVSWQVTISNAGPAAAFTSSLSVRLSDGRFVDLVTATPDVTDAATCTRASATALEQSCELGSIPADGSVVYSARTTGAQAMTLTATVDTLAADRNLANNKASSVVKWPTASPTPLSTGGGAGGTLAATGPEDTNVVVPLALGMTFLVAGMVVLVLRKKVASR